MEMWAKRLSRTFNCITITLYAAVKLVSVICMWFAQIADNIAYGFEITPTMDMMSKIFNKIFDGIMSLYE